MFKIGDKVRVTEDYPSEGGYEGTVIQLNPSNGDDVRVHITNGGKDNLFLTYRNRNLELIKDESDDQSLVNALNRHTEAMLKLVEALGEHSHQMSIYEK